jgi:hypothetical protein
MYAAFNARRIDPILAVMCEEVVWPNGIEGGVVHGHEGVRAYWTRQWAMIDPKVTPLSMREEADGALDLEVHQTHRGPTRIARTRVRCSCIDTKRRSGIARGGS